MNVTKLLPLTKRKLEILFEIYSSENCYLHKLVRELNMSLSLCSKILTSLVNCKILKKERKGKEVYYSFISGYEYNLLIPVLNELYLEKRAAKYEKCRNFITLVRNNKEIVSSCKYIFVFGSYARGSANQKSDLDVLFVTSNKKLISKFCREISIILNLQIDGVVFNEKKFEENLRKKEPFINSIVNNPKERLIVFGNI
ncbi:MAG: nucleotidyltransferase domain-containing protein [Candidatus Aenigmarchaeota archaeon]|nr:nucleotidyltransferase domain-containing protein [Candidatus Aenigmarchaeota archaeon]